MGSKDGDEGNQDIAPEALATQIGREERGQAGGFYQGKGVQAIVGLIVTEHVRERPYECERRDVPRSRIAAMTRYEATRKRVG